MKQFTFKDVSTLNKEQYVIYSQATNDAYPPFFSHSAMIKNHWDKLADYFPEYQLVMQNANSEIIGFINSIPFKWNEPLNDLPDEGWDWLFQKGIEDYEQLITPNCLGGIQINVLPSHRGQGYSKLLLQRAKKLFEERGFEHYLLPIRPNFKWKYPALKMEEYMRMEKDNKIYDPWIRTHVQSGCKVLSVCKKSMFVEGDIAFWEKQYGKHISTNSSLIIEGALNPIHIDLSNNKGTYNEENIWIAYNNSQMNK